MDSYYEEFIKFNSLKDKDEEIQKYLFPEEITECERITIICKRGASFQRKALMNNILCSITKKKVLEHFFESVNVNSILLKEFFELWEESLQINFAETIVKILKNTYFEEININVLYTLIKLCVKVISTDEKTVIIVLSKLSVEFIYAFNEICDYITSRLKIKIDNEVYDIVLNLGGYSKGIQSKRYCVYLCSCLIRISESINNGIVNRFLLLSSENEIVIKNEISFQFRFLFKELDEIFIRKNFYKVIENYLNENENSCVFLTFESVLINFSKFSDSLYITLINKILSNIFLRTAPDSFDLQINIVFCIIEFPQHSEINKEFLQISKKFLKEVLLKKDEKDIILKELIIKFEALAKYLEIHCDVTLLQEVYNYIVNCIFESDILNHRNIKKLFYDNIIRFLKTSLKYKFHKMFKLKLFSVLDDVNQNKHLISVLIMKLVELFQMTDWIEENIIDYQIYFKKLEEYLIKDKDWRNLNSFLEAHLNSDLILQNEEISPKLFFFLKTVLNEKNYQVQVKSMRLLAKCIKYSNKSIRDDILTLSFEIASSKTYFTRRLFFPFFETILSQFSSNFIIENNILQKCMKFMDDNSLSLYLFIKLLPKIYFMVYNDPVIRFKLENRLKSIKQDSKDIEIINEVKKFQFFMNNYHEKFIYSTSYLELSLNDRLKNDQETAIFNKDTRLVQQSNSTSLINYSKKSMLETMDDLYRKRGKNMPTKIFDSFPKKTGQTKIVTNNRNIDTSKLLNYEKSSKDIKSPILTKTFIEAKDSVKNKEKEKKNRGLSSRELTYTNKEKLNRHPTPANNLPQLKNFNSNNSKLPVLNKNKK